MESGSARKGLLLSGSLPYGSATGGRAENRMGTLDPLCILPTLFNAFEGLF